MKTKCFFVAFLCGLSFLSVAFGAPPEGKGGGKGNGSGGAKSKLSVAPSSLVFSDQPTGTVSAAQIVELKNQGKESLTIDRIELEGTDFGQFRIDHDCITTLEWRARCSVFVSYSPNSVAYPDPHQATLRVATALTTSTSSVGLTGNTSAPANQWTWIAGANYANDPGVYGEFGQPTSTTRPSARSAAAGWVGLNGNLYLLGGYTADNVLLNDLWEYNVVDQTWRWIGGAAGTPDAGQYGNKGQPSVLNWPGARHFARSWRSADGAFWLYGGQGMDAYGTSGSLNDLWKLNPESMEWTWVSGSDMANPVPTFGQKGVPDSANQPPAKTSAAGWISLSGELWLFGGSDESGFANDVWKFDPVTELWTWIAGSEQGNSTPVYGTQGVADPVNTPGARNGSAAWVTPDGLFWLFGGVNSSGAGGLNLYSDLWMFNPQTTLWTWIGGASGPNATPSYGVKGVSSPTNLPPARYNVAGWYDQASNSHYVFAGSVVDGSRRANDLWRYSLETGEWTWLTGSSEIEAFGTYGLLGEPDPLNSPGARSLPLSWSDRLEAFWIFGSSGNAELDSGKLNDLWKYQP